MKYKKIIKISAISAFLMLNACASQPTKPKYDVYKLGGEAEKAYKNKNWKVAEEKYSALILVSPGEAEFWLRIGNIYARTSRPEKAIAAYEEALVRRPGYKKAWRNLGVLSLRKTTHFYMEMLKFLEPESLMYIRAKKTSEVLIKLIEKNQAKNKITNSNSGIAK